MHAQTLHNAYDLLIVIFRDSDPSILQWYNDGVSFHGSITPNPDEDLRFTHYVLPFVMSKT